MAFRATAASRPLPHSNSNLNSKCNHHKPDQQHKLPPLRHLPLLSSSTTTALSVLAIFATPDAALAFSREDVVSSLTKVEDTIDLVGDAGSKALDVTQQVIEVLAGALKPAFDFALPLLRGAGEEALKVASPVVSDATEQAKEALQSVGVDASPVLSAASTVVQQTPKVIEGAKPIASATMDRIMSSDPTVIAVSAGALFLTYLLLPPIWSLVTSSFRGYKGNLSPAQTLDLISKQNCILIDIRSEKDKNKAGIPRLPSNANKIISVAMEELPGKIKSIVRNTKKVEAEITALKISYLKKINKGSTIVILDSFSDVAKIVAKTLTSFGFKNCYIMTGGFSGGKGWLQSRLGTDSYNVSITEILSPSRIIPAASRLGTTSSIARQ